MRLFKNMVLELLKLRYINFKDMKRIVSLVVLFFSLIVTIGAFNDTTQYLDTTFVVQDSIVALHDSTILLDSTKCKIRCQARKKIRKDIVEFKKEPFPYQRSLNTMEKWILPSLCLSYGVSARLEWFGVRKLDYYVRDNVKNSFHHRYTFDNYLQYVPVLSVFAFEPLGLKPRHNFKQRLALTAMAYAIGGTTVLVGKEVFGVMRPDDSTNNSFPSGHTFMAMTGSHLSFQEYRQNSPWVAGMYVVGGTAAMMRSVNNRHWVSDVVTSVGISIISVEVAYMLLPYVDEWLNLSTTTKNGATLALTPMVTPNSAGALFVIQF